MRIPSYPLFVAAAFVLGAAATFAQTTAPVITSYDASSSTPSFNGTADAGVTVTVSALSTLTRPKATAATDGTWSASWTGTPLDPGTYHFYAYATDAAGHMSSSSAEVVVTVAPTSIPVVQPIPDQDTTWQFFRHDEPTTLSAYASNAPQSFAATGYPSGVSFSTQYNNLYANGTRGEFRWTYGSLGGGKSSVTVTATNSVGTSAPVTFTWVVHPGMNYFVTTDKRLYEIGERITFTTKFSAPVVVTGTPYLPLWGTKRAVYTGGSGTSTLTFSYLTASDDAPQSNLYYDRITLDAGGSIQTTDGVSASLTDTYAGLGDYPYFSLVAPGTPVATGVTINAQVGTAITPVQLQATNSPTSFTTVSPTALESWGLHLSNTGLVTGTPTAWVTDARIAFTASNSTGQSQPAYITLNIAPASTTAKSDQTITFSSPVSALVIGHPIFLGATSSAGLPITYSVVSGDAKISGNTLTPTSTANLIVRASSSGSATVNPASVDVVFGTPQKAAQNITLGLTGGTVPAEKPITLSGTTTSGLPITYALVTGPATISGNTLNFTGTGTVVVRAAQAGDATYAPASDVTLTFTANPVDRLVNFSARLPVGPDAGHIAIAGFVVTGSTPKPVLIRAVGPGLRQFGVTDGVSAPQLQLLDNDRHVIATNSGWNNDAQISTTGDNVGAFHLTSGSLDAAILATLAPGAYTALVSSASSGSVLIEVYDGTSNATVPTKQLINLSSRSFVEAGGPMIGGFVVSGAETKRVLVRAIGPGLIPFGVSGVLSDPVVNVYDSTGTLVAQNDNWETGQPMAGKPAPATAAQLTAADTAAGAFVLQPGAKDAAVLLTLPPGAYTAVVNGASGATGAALVEIYEVNLP